MLFTANREFLDGYDRFQADEEYDVTEDRAKYFVSLGWGTSPELSPPPAGNSAPARVTLQPHDVTSGSGSEFV